MEIKHFFYGKQRTFLIFAVLFVLLFWNLGETGLLDPDEGRYSEIPREMIESGDYITPRLNDVKYFEKPVLYYWMTALSFRLFGKTETAVRAVSALLAFLTVLCTWILAHKVYDRDIADRIAVILGTSLLFYAIARISLTDMPLVFFMTLSFVSAWWAIREERVHRGALCVFYAGVALSLLTKGLIGIVLPGCVLLAYILCTRRFRLVVDLLYPPGILLFFAVVLPWFWMVCTRNRDFFYFFFIREHFLRYATAIHGRYQPMWFFVPVLLAGLVPWVGFLPGALRDVWEGTVAEVRRSWGAAVRPGCRDADLYLFLWAAVIFLFFSVSRSKLIPYIVPVMPPLAILMGRAIAARARGDGRKAGLNAALWTGSVFLGALAVAFLACPFVLRDPRLDMQFVRLVGVGYGSALLVFIGLSLMCRVFADGQKWFYALSAVAFLLCAIASKAPNAVAGSHSSREIAGEVNRILRPDDVVANYRDYMHGLTFYTQRRTLLVREIGELEFGLNAEPERNADWFLDDRSFLPVWKGPRRVLLVIGALAVKELPDYVGEKHYVLARTRHRLVLSNRAD